ncbi:MAG: DMT family transporter [Propionibacteriaceae bacterium]|nr:DMT family transporter [Propionibacteriaceae bacterium]
MPSLSARFALGFVVAASLCWSLLGIWGKQAQAAGVGPIEIGFWRALIAGVLFLAQALAVRADFPRGRALVGVAALGLVTVALFYTSYQYSVRFGGASLASVLLYTAPAMVAILGWLFLKERLGPREIGAVIACVSGVALIGFGGGQGVSVGLVSVATGLTAGLCYALYYLFGRTLLRHYHPAAVFAVMMLAGAAALLPFTRHHPVDAPGWLNVLGLGIIGTWVAYLLSGLGLKHVAATRASVVSSVEPVAAMLLAAWLFHERLAPLALVGAALVVGAAVALSLPRKANAAAADRGT